MAEMQVHLTLVGDDFDTSYVTREIGMQPQSIREKDEVLGNGRLFGHTEWGFHTKLIETDDSEELIASFVSKINCPSETLFRLSQKCSAKWHMGIFVKICNNSSTTLYLCPEAIEFAARLKADVWFDTYVCSTDEVEEFDIE